MLVALALLLAAEPAFAGPMGRSREAGPGEPDDGAAATWNSDYRVDHVMHFLVGFQMGFVAYAAAATAGMGTPGAVATAQVVTAVVGLCKETWDSTVDGGSGWEWLDLAWAATGSLLGSLLAVAFTP